MPSPRRSLGALAVVVSILAACDTGDGRTLRPPPPGATAPPMPTSSTTATATTAVLGTPEAPFLLTSTAFTDGGPIPDEHASCGGDDVSVPLSWSGVPAETVELALTVVDPDAPSGPFVHWVVTGIDPVVTGFTSGGLPESAVEVRPWVGPCPPEGETHTYVFTLFALSAATGVTAETGTDGALAAIESTPGPTATLVGAYTRAS